MVIRMVFFAAVDGDDQPSSRPEGDDLARRLDQQVRRYVGPLDDEDWDRLDYEEEFARFERFTKKGRR